VASDLVNDGANVGADVVLPFQRLYRQLIAEVEGLDETVLGWAPDPDTTPISNLVLHVLGAARRHLSNLAGAPQQIDRAAEFSAAPLPAAELVDRIEEAARELEQYRDRLTTGDLLAQRDRPARELAGKGLVVLLVAYGHVTEHLAQIRLTKQLYAQAHRA
jgi:hypothetical protein